MWVRARKIGNKKKKKKEERRKKKEEDNQWVPRILIYLQLVEKKIGFLNLALL